MPRRFWVTPKQLCELTRLTPEEINRFKDEYCFDVHCEDGVYLIDLLDFCYIYKSTCLARNLSLAKDDTPIPLEAFER